MLSETKIAYTVNEAMAAIGIGRTKFYELAREGKIDLRIVGGRTLATAVSLHRLVNEAERWESSASDLADELKRRTEATESGLNRTYQDVGCNCSFQKGHQPPCPLA